MTAATKGGTSEGGVLASLEAWTGALVAKEPWPDFCARLRRDLKCQAVRLIDRSGALLGESLRPGAPPPGDRGVALAAVRGARAPVVDRPAGGTRVRAPLLAQDGLVGVLEVDGLAEERLVIQALSILANTTACAVESAAGETARRWDEELRLTIDSTPVGLWKTGVDGGWELVNQTWLEATGTTVAENLGDGWLRAVHPGDRDRVVEAHRVAIERREGYTLNLRLIVPKGDPVWTMTIGRPLLRAGEFVGFVGMAIDISEWRRAVLDIDRFFEISVDVLCIAGFDGFFHRINPAFERALGFSVDELCDRPYLHFVHPDDHATAYEKLSQLALGAKVVNYETRLRTQSGEFRWFEWNATAVADEEAIYAVGRDISERKRGDRELLAARKLADKASRTQGEFLARVSHEIRTPMNGVIGMTGLLLDTPLSADQHEYAEAIRKSAAALLILINDILDFSKIEAGKLAVEPVSFDLSTALDEVTDLLAPLAQEKGVEFIVHLAPDAPRFLVGDPGRIRQILINLADNALKFTVKGHVFVNVSCVDQDEGSARLRFAVHDTGIGMTPEAQGSLFQPFYQADSGSTRRFGGTGLGLAICRQLVELMGGSIAAESALGRGSTFSFTLPLPKDLAIRGDMRDYADLVDVRVMVVDHHRINRWMLREQLLSLGMRPTVCASPTDAVAVFAAAAQTSDPFTLALIDDELKVAPTGHLVDLIAGDPRFCETTVIKLVAYGQRLPAVDAPAATVLVKPVRLAALRETVIEARRGGERGEVQRTGGGFGERSFNERFRGKVLVVEDNVINQRVASLMLERLGCRVDVAADGLEAVTMVGQIPYDLVFMDCQMPEMDGFQATRKIRQRERTGRVPIAAMTAHALPDDRQRCLDAGMDEYLSKPVQLGELIRVVAKYLEEETRAVPVEPVVEEPVVEEPVVEEPVVEAPVAEAPVVEAPVAEAPVAEARLAALDGSILEQLSVLVEDDEDGLFGTFLQPFIVSAQGSLDAMRAALEADDQEMMRRIAHKLKGSGGTLGAAEIESICSELMLGGERPETEARAALGVLEAAIDRVAVAVEELRGKGSRSAP